MLLQMGEKSLRLSAKSSALLLLLALLVQGYGAKLTALLCSAVFF